MKTTAMMLTVLLCLVLSSAALESQDLVPIPLNMMDQSVDDMYSGCNETMAKKVKNLYFPKEKNTTLFDASKTANICAKRVYKRTKNIEVNEDHILAICMYTQQYPNIFEPFNEAVRGGAAKYNTDAFQYHTLHYWLTTAVQILNRKKCLTAYRRTKSVYEGQVNHEMRFGSFASSSVDLDLTTFGEKTCFHIETCYGASIESYSNKHDEQEVLIPPYEKFKIIKIIKKGSYKGLKCEKIFVLKSTGLLSNVNCKAAHTVK